MDSPEIPYTHDNLGEGDEGDWFWQSPERGYGRYILPGQHHDPQHGPQWWGVASHDRPSGEVGPDA